MFFIRPATRRVLYFCLSVMMMMTPPLVAAEGAPELRLVVTDKTVEVFDQAGRSIQSLPFDGETPDEDTRDYFAIAEDMNFDGFPDVRVLFSQGMVNLYYDCWLWRPDENAFVRRDDMCELSNPVFDQAARTIRVYERGSAACHVEGELAWKNDALVWLSKIVRDQADDGESSVVRHYLRDRGGELRLVGEKTFRAEEPDGERVSTIGPPPEMSGFNLVLDVEAEPLDAAILPNGEWWLYQGLPDRTLLIESRRLPPLEYDGETLRRFVHAEWPLAREVEVAPFPVLAEKTTYPVFKAEFLNGENEDTRQFVAVLVFADDWSFWFVLNASADAELSPDDDADGDAATGSARLKKAMESLLLRIKPADPSEGGFLPGFIPVFYMAGPDSPLSTSVMDALIRIKKIVGPEHSRWIEPGTHAYRYDGPGTVAGVPVLRFSFGADAPEEFSAERRFAVDAEGTVREMGADGEYWTWDERGASWWGEYRRGDALLRVTNYREGPFGMYFVFDFTIGETTVYDGTAEVRGRSARYESFIFTLAKNGESVVVTFDPEEERDEEAFPNLEGVYKAE